MAESTVFAPGTVEFAGLLPSHTGILFDHHLTYAVAVIDGEVVLAEVYEYYADLAAVVGVDGSWSIRYCHAVIESHAASGTYLTFIARGELHVQARGYQSTLQRLQR